LKYIWKKLYKEINKTQAQALYDDLKNSGYPFPKSFIVLLVQRGITTAQEAVTFLKEYDNFQVNDFSDPNRLPDMSKALTRLKQAYENKEGILIFGDYDADGITSTTILYRFFKQYFPQSPLYFYQPSRFNDGYGFNKTGVDFAIKKKLSLIITVDCGISNHDTVDYATEKQIDVIVTDHHEAPQELPKALALIDPKRKDIDLPFREWAGVGVAFNLILAFSLAYSDICKNFKMAPYLEIAGIGTIGDIVPVYGENRTIIKACFNILNRAFRGRFGINLGLYQLRSIANSLNTMNSKKIAFQIVPRLNAASRMEEASIATNLLITDNNEEVENLAKKLNALNNQRKDKQKLLLKEIQDHFKNHPEELQFNIILYAKENTDEGVRGIAASNIVKVFNKPTIILSIDKENNKISGSGRSVPNINLHKFLSQFESFFNTWGGHEQAIGLSMQLNKFENFKKLIQEKSLEEFQKEDLTPTLDIDTIINPIDLNKKYADWVSQLEPFGTGNTRPKFFLQNMHILKIESFTANNNNTYLNFLVESKDNLHKAKLRMWSPEEKLNNKSLTQDFLNSLEYKTADFIITITTNISQDGQNFVNFTIEDLHIKK